MATIIGTTGNDNLQGAALS